MQSLKEIEQTAYNLGNFLSSGLTLSTATKRMQSIQPKYAADWNKITDQINQGVLLSKSLEKLWPEDLLHAVYAGENAGELPEVFNRIEQNSQLHQKIQKTVAKLSYPAGLIGAGLLVFTLFMIFIIPIMRDSLNFTGAKQDQNIVFEISTWMENVYHEQWMLALGVIGGCVFGIYSFFSSASNRKMMLNFMVGLPYLGKALTKLYFGLWAYYVSMLFAAGNLNFRDMIMIPSKVLPDPLSEGMGLFLNDVDKKGMADAADPEKQPDGDPRKSWPFYINYAFMFAHDTGNLDTSLLKVAPVLLNEGFNEIEKALKIINLIALVIAAMIVGLAPIAYYYQLATSLADVMKF